MSLEVKNKRVVTINYELKDVDGNIIDSSKEHGPLPYLHGAGNIIIGLEKQIAGKKVGDKFQAVVKPEEGYGVTNKDLIEEVNKDDFEDVDEIEVGMPFEYENEDGSVDTVFVKEIGEDTITVDGNHPLAGKELHFDIEVVEVREATKEEIDHKHVHGHGHHH